METHANALTSTLEYAGEPRRPHAAARSVQDHRDLSESDKREIGEHAYPPYDHKGLVVAASAWLAFYVFAAIHGFIALGN
jgi:hypothetical protein